MDSVSSNGKRWQQKRKSENERGNAEMLWIEYIKESYMTVMPNKLFPFSSSKECFVVRSFLFVLKWMRLNNGSINTSELRTENRVWNTNSEKCKNLVEKVKYILIYTVCTVYRTYAISIFPFDTIQSWCQHRFCSNISIFCVTFLCKVNGWW